MKPFSSKRLALLSAVSALTMLAFELVLIRTLAIASWHHFTFVVIAMVLLGLGASGTALTLFRARLLERSTSALRALGLVASLALPWCYSVAQRVPIEANFAPADLFAQLISWGVFWLILTVPIFVSGTIIGLSLMCAGRNVPLVYGSNLLGSAVGALLGLWLMDMFAVELVPLILGSVLFIFCSVALGFTRLIVVAGSCLLTWLWFDGAHLTLRVDQFKYKAYVNQLVGEGQARRLSSAFSHRGQWEIYAGDIFHQVNFLGHDRTPPPTDLVLRDGHLVGAIPKISSRGDAEFLQHTLAQIAYRLAPNSPRVLLLDEYGTPNVWLALTNNASSITVVQEDPAPKSLLMQYSPYRTISADDESLDLVAANARRFLHSGSGQYDIIQLASFESLGVGSGLHGLAENYLLTVEGLSQAIRRLSEVGIVFSCRGMQNPPRDNLKLLATVIEALREVGVAEPASHVIQYRDFLALCTVVRRSAWTRYDVSKVGQLLADLQLTPVYFQGINEDVLNQPDQLPSAAGTRGDWYYFAATRLLSPDSAKFVRDWPFDIRPPRDDRPYFFDYFRVNSLLAIKQQFGPAWITRTEIAYLFVLLTLGLSAGAALVLIVIPLLFSRRLRACGGSFWTLLYFGSIGFGYMLLEIVLLSRLIHMLGDSSVCTATTISAFLFWSGVGSLAVLKLGRRLHGSLPLILIFAGILGIAELFAIQHIGSLLVDYPLGARILAAFFTLAPLGVVLGFPFAGAISLMERSQPEAVPWAWGVNGFASVIAPPLGVAIAMSFNFYATAFLALGLYGLAALAYGRLSTGGNIGAGA